MTVKTKNYSVNAQEWRLHKDYGSPTITVTGPLPNDSGTRQWSVIRTGVDNPKWRSMVRDAQNATTDYTVVGREYNTLKAFGQVHYFDNFGRTYVAGFRGHPTSFSWLFQGDPSTLISTSADLLARQRFISKYRSRRTAFQGGVFLGELLETVRLIKRPASALREGIDDYYRAVKKRLRKSKPRNRKRIIQDSWLEFSFGWKPLIHDVQDACALATAEPFAVNETIKGGAKDVVSSVHTQSSYTIPIGCRVGYTVVNERFCIVVYKGAIRAVNSPVPFPEQLGLSWSNLAPTVWELIPYSFLVDYFTNIGKVIEGVSTGTISLAWGCRNEIKKEAAEIIDRGFDFNFAATTPLKPFGTVRLDGYGSIAGPYCSRTNYSRAKIDSVSVGIGDASFKLPGSNTRWLNIAALAKLRR